MIAPEYVDGKIAEFFATLPHGFLMRAWMLFNIIVFCNFLNGLVNGYAMLPDVFFLLFMIVCYAVVSNKEITCNCSTNTL